VYGARRVHLDTSFLTLGEVSCWHFQIVVNPDHEERVPDRQSYRQRRCGHRDKQNPSGVSWRWRRDGTDRQSSNVLDVYATGWRFESWSGYGIWSSVMVFFNTCTGFPRWQLQTDRHRFLYITSAAEAASFSTAKISQYRYASLNDEDTF
jgi:hypothetical protein